MAVRDTGAGMDDVTRERIFEPFFTTKEIGRGTGLGLSVVHGIVSQYGGFITVTSDPGRGTEFRIYLPAVAGEPKRAQEREPVPVRGGSETILVAEDEPALQSKIRKVLTDAGYEVLIAADGDEALRLGQTHRGPIHLLLTDIVMPKLSGRQLSERLAALRPESKVLYMYGYPDVAVGSVHRRLHHVLQKPFTKEKLLRQVRGILDGGAPAR
jgi:CheY-like chemotaxis protein